MTRWRICRGDPLELVSETPAPLSAAKWRDAKRNNSRKHYDIRPSGTFLTLMSSWTNEVKAFGTTSETGSLWSPDGWRACGADMT